MIAITLPDGSVKQFKSETTPMGVAHSISEGFARNVISCGKTFWEEVWKINLKIL